MHVFKKKILFHKNEQYDLHTGVGTETLTNKGLFVSKYVDFYKKFFGLLKANKTNIVHLYAKLK